MKTIDDKTEISLNRAMTADRRQESAVTPGWAEARLPGAAHHIKRIRSLHFSHVLNQSFRASPAGALRAVYSHAAVSPQQ